MASPDAVSPEDAERSAERAIALAARLGIVLPAECVGGVRGNAELLDAHWLNLRRSPPSTA